jgi:Piwi domain
MPVEEALYLNTIPFEYPKEPVTFYFSLDDGDGLKKLNHVNFPANIKDIYPGITNGDPLYTSFDRKMEGLQSLAIDFFLPENYYLVKRFYNRQLRHYLNRCNLFVEPNRITNDNQIWKLDNYQNPRQDCDQYNRFTLKMDYDQFNKRPQLLLSFDRPTLVYKTCVEEILRPSTDDPFTPTEKPQASADIIKRVLYKEERVREDGTTFTYRKIDKYKYLLENWEDFDSKNAYPIMNNKLATYLGFDNATDEEVETENSQYADFTTPNRYKKYYDKIQYFYKTYLDNDNFRALIPIAKDGFAWANKLQIGHTKYESKELLFGGKKVEVNPQMGVNNGPYENARGANIQIIGIFIKDDILPARNLLKYFRDGYSDHYFAGLKKYTGKDFTFAPPELHLQIENKKNPIPEIEHFLYNAGQNQKLDSDANYLALYLTPICKNATNKEDRKIYYQVKELLLKYKIVSQTIETTKMLAVLADDEKNKRKNFAFTLQNMAIAMNAKLGGTPWRINVRKQDELIIGIGAFKNIDTNTQYIGSAFSFDNTGAFTSFQYFQKDELKELAGSIKHAIITFSNANGIPARLIIHYYKEMSLVKEYPHIENVLNDLKLNIPVYIVTINKTESESVLLFDGKNSDLMPYSGRYIHLGNKSYLLCNNTRYENAQFRKKDGFPFPVKLKIECPSSAMQDIDTATIESLIDQIYQFSRIYWKSVKQQNLPVTIKYPSMIAQMMPHFNNASIDHIDTRNLWFL